MRYGGEASNEFNQGYEVNQAMMADELALIAYDIKMVRSYVMGMVQKEARLYSVVDKLTNVIDKLEGL